VWVCGCVGVWCVGVCVCACVRACVRACVWGCLWVFVGGCGWVWVFGVGVGVGVGVCVCVRVCVRVRVRARAYCKSGCVLGYWFMAVLGFAVYMLDTGKYWGVGNDPLAFVYNHFLNSHHQVESNRERVKAISSVAGDYV